jgi:hypothetical protein
MDTDTRIMVQGKGRVGREKMNVEVLTRGNGKIMKVFVSYLAGAQGQHMYDRGQVRGVMNPFGLVPGFVPGFVNQDESDEDDDDDDDEDDDEDDDGDDDDEDDDDEEEDDEDDPKREPKEIKEEDLCKICFSREKNCVLVPCGHKCMCMECAKVLKKGKAQGSFICPICKRRIKQTVKVFEC